MIRRLRIGAGAFLLWVVAGAAVAAPHIQVQALFSGFAVLNVDGVQRTLRVGQTSPEGIRLIAADSDAAVLEVDGRRARYALGAEVAGSYHDAPSDEVDIWRNPQGMFTTVGSINGMPVSFLVDTGATTVAMNADAARQLGIDFRVVGNPGLATTASGVAKVYKVTLDSVGVGGIKLRNVSAVVFEGNLPDHVLLGMSFLGRLDMHNDGRRLRLKRKY